MAGEKLSIGTQTLTAPVNGGVATTTNRPYGLSDYNADVNLTLEVIDQKLELESTLDDVFIGVDDPVVYTGEKVTVPNDFIMKLDYAQGVDTAIIPIADALTGPARQGTSEKQRGYERDRTLKSMKVYYNEYSQALTGEKWGKNFNDLNKFGYYNGIQPSLSKYFQELHGKHYREALLETYSEPLTKTGVALTQNFNPNIFVANTEFGLQPTYDSTVADYTDAIGQVLSSAATGTNGVNANIDLDFLINLEEYARVNKRINPIIMGGQRRYVCVLPSKQFTKLIKNQAGQLGEVWVDVSALTKEEQAYPGTVGRVRSLIIVSDDRYATVEYDGYTGSGDTATVEYVEPGNDDSRNTTVYDASSNKAWDVGYLLGTNAVWDWTKRTLHFEEDEDEYGKVYGKGAFTERGIGLSFYDVDSADQDDDSRDNWSSIALFFSATTLVATA